MSAAGVFRRMPLWQKIVSTIFPALCREQGWRSLGNQRTKRRLLPLPQSVRKARLETGSFHHASVGRSDDAVSSAEQTAPRQKTGCPRADSPYPLYNQRSGILQTTPDSHSCSHRWNAGDRFITIQNTKPLPPLQIGRGIS